MRAPIDLVFVLFLDFFGPFFLLNIFSKFKFCLPFVCIFYKNFIFFFKLNLRRPRIFWKLYKSSNILCQDRWLSGFFNTILNNKIFFFIIFFIIFNNKKFLSAVAFCVSKRKKLTLGRSCSQWTISVTCWAIWSDATWPPGSSFSFVSLKAFRAAEKLFTLGAKFEQYVLK